VGGEGGRVKELARLVEEGTSWKGQFGADKDLLLRKFLEGKVTVRIRFPKIGRHGPLRSLYDLNRKVNTTDISRTRREN